MGTIVKKQWRRILSVILAVAMVINVTPLGTLNVSAASGTEYTVTVTDSISGDALANATVTVQYFDFGAVTNTTMEDVTNDDGKCTFSVTGKLGILGIAISHPGYEDGSYDIPSEGLTWEGGEAEEEYPVSLTPKQFNVTFDNGGVGEFSNITNVTDDKAYYGREVSFGFTPKQGYENVTFSAGTDNGSGGYTATVTEDVVITASATDTMAPELSVENADNTTVANKREITFSATDNSGVTPKFYVSMAEDFASVDKTTDATSPYAVTANGTYYVYAVDTAGNVAKSDPIEVSGLDTEPPEIVLAANSSGETNSNVTITVITADTDIAKVVYGTTSVYEQATEITPDDGVYSFTATADAETSNTNTYYVWAVDKAGNISEVASVKVNIDKISPIFTVSASDGTNAYAADTWTNAEEITVEPSSAEANVTFKYGTSDVIGDAAEYATPVVISASEGEQVEKTLYFWAVDKLGNVSQNPTAFVVKIDRKGAVVDTAAASTSNWTDDDVTISGTVSDEGVGVEKVLYSSTNNFAEAEEAELNGDSFEFKVTVQDGTKFDGDYYIWAVDSLGNPSTAKTVDVKIDKVVPSAGSPVPDPATWTNTDVVVTGVATDSGSGVEKVVYSHEDMAEDEVIAEIENVVVNTENDDEFTYTFTIPKDSEYSTYYVWAIDNVGNISGKAAVAVQIDIAPPYAGTPVAAPDVWTNGNVTISGTATDAKLTAKIVYSTAEMTEAAVLAATENVVVNTENDDEFTYTFTVFNTAEYNGDYYVYAVDAAGNVSDEATVKVYIDTTVPTVDSVETYVGTEPIDFSQTNVWTNQNVTVSGTVSDDDSQTANSDIAKVVYSTDGTLQEAAVKALTTVADYANGKYSFVVENSTDFNGAYYVWTIDVAGNVSAPKSIKVKIETKEPEIKGLFHKTTGEGAEDIEITSVSGTDNYYYFNAAMDVYATFIDENLTDTNLVSGVAKLEYSVNQKDWEIADTLESVYSLHDLNKHHTVWARVTDYAGNVSDEVYTKVVILDDQKPVDGSATAEDTAKPVIRIAHNGTKLNDIYSGDVTLDISIMDPILVDGVMIDYNSENPVMNGVLSGLKTIHYEVKAEDINAQESSNTLLASGTKVVYGVVDGEGGFIHKWTNKLTVKADDFNSNNVVVSVWAEDNAGNKSDTATTAFKIDKTKPVVKVSFDNNTAQNEKYFQDDRTATIKVTERNFDPTNTKWIINGSEKIVSTENWNKTEGNESNGDGTTWTTKVSFTSEDDYEFKITTVKDLAGNEAAEIKYDGQAPNEFTVDKTNPKIDVSYDNNTVTNEKFFAANRTATVTITERNFDEKFVEEEITASLNGAGISVPSVSWHSSGDKHTATIRYDADGDYTFDIAVTDLSGRKNDDVDYGSSAAPIDFTIDTTIEKPIITGVENGVAYKGAVVPVITFNDVNYMSHTISLLRTRMGERNVDVTAELLGAAAVNDQGFSLTAANFEEIRENDGIYTLTVTATDRAGNEEMETVTFTVNRFGSVYVFSEYLADLISNGGKYVPSVTEDLVITEYNPDKLVEDSLIIEVTRDGKPIDANFSVSPEINAYVTVGESGWFQYRYTLDKANFTADGIYKISVSSQDETGNYPEIANFEDMEILFRVDSTAPEITSVVGLEEAIVNAQELEVRYSLFDAIALKSVKLYVDGKLVEEVVDFDDMNNYEGRFVLSENSSRQSVRLVVEDMAGNITDTSAENFESAYVFNPEVTVSTNVFVRWFANKPLFFGSIGGVGAAAAAAWYFLIFKRRKENEEA